MLPAVKLAFLGTGASGGAAGQDRSGRFESSLLISDGTALLLDVTRHFAVQAQRLTRIEPSCCRTGTGTRAAALRRCVAGGLSDAARGRSTSF
jgi:hypothetical protein